MSTKFNVGDTVRYYGAEYTVFETHKRSEIIVLKATGKKSDLLYVWEAKCRKVR